MSEDSKPTKERIDQYDARIDQLRGYCAPYTEAFGARSYEYGVMAVKSLLTPNGGAIVALPAIAGILRSSDMLPSLYWAAGEYILGLVAAIAVAYLVHLNFPHLYSLVESHLEKRQKEAEKLYLGSIREGDDSVIRIGREIRRREWIVARTFWGPHIFGIASPGLFVLASFQVLTVFAQ